MRTYLFHALIVISVLVAATWLAGPVREGAWVKDYDTIVPIADKQGKRFKSAIAEQKPKLVLIGDSILDSAVSGEQLSASLGMPCYVFAIRGAASALWYLMLKEGVIASGHQPTYVVLLFRDVYLTVPGWRTNAAYRGLLNHFDQQRDPLLVQLAYDPPTNPLRDFMRHEWPLYQVRGPAREKVENLREKTLAALFGVSETEIKQSVDKAFANEAMDQELLSRAQQALEVPLENQPYFDFESQVEQSFLPHMLHMAKESNIKLIFVRSKARRELPSEIEANGTSRVTDELIPDYIVDLRAYLEEQGIPFIDLTGEQRLRLEHYAEGDHFNTDLGKPLFTEILAEKLKELKLQ